MVHRLFSFLLCGLVMVVVVGAGPAPSLARAGDGTPFGPSPQERAARAMEADRLLGPELVCPITRDGVPVGEHRMTFRRQGETLHVRARSEIEVTIAFIPVYRLSYFSRGVWRDGRLQSLSAHTNDNGRKTVVAVRRNAQGALEPEKGGSWSPRPGPVFTTNHWNPAVIGAREVLNTISGAMNQVTMTHEGEETLDAGAGPVRASHFTYRGQLRADVWYDEQGRWIKLAFDGSDGSRIEYLCDQPREADTAHRQEG